MRKTSKEEFYHDIEKYLSAGLFRVVYETDAVCVVNACNYGYVALPFLKTSHGVQIGISFNARGLKKVTQDVTYVHKKLLYGSQAYMKECLVVLNEYFYQRLVEIKKETDEKGPGPGVDLSLELSIRKQQKSNR